MRDPSRRGRSATARVEGKMGLVCRKCGVMVEWQECAWYATLAPVLCLGVTLDRRGVSAVDFLNRNKLACTR